MEKRIRIKKKLIKSEKDSTNKYIIAGSLEEKKQWVMKQING